MGSAKHESSSRPSSRSWRAPITAPGPQGRDMLTAIGAIRNNPLAFLARMQRQYGDLVQFPIPRPPTYLVSHPDDVRTLLVSGSRGQSKRTLQYNNLATVTGNGLLTADDPPWRAHRRVMQPAFHHSELAGVVAHT
ncbi:MAG: cytochrome P450, partial [Candidatus Nanopelagicales bacterium]